MITAVLFDMDGLLIDSEPCWEAARQEMASEAGTHWNEDDHLAVMGASSDEWANYMIERLALRMAPQEVQDEVIRRMVAMYKRSIPFFPGAIEAVHLASLHYITALASGSPPELIDAVVNSEPLQDRFQEVLSADTVGPGKPAPDVYLETARRLGIAPEHCVCLEDSGNGIISGKSAGMKVIAIPDPRFPPHAEKLAQADLVLGSLLSFSVNTIEQLDDESGP